MEVFRRIPARGEVISNPDLAGKEIARWKWKVYMESWIEFSRLRLPAAIN
jgi:hypothetical protein